MDRTLSWKLDGHEVVPATLEEADGDIGHRVAEDMIGTVRVSTVFLGIDHNHFGQGPPLLFETMVFAPGDAELDMYMRRCSTWGQAEAQHRVMVDYVKGIASLKGTP